LLSFLLLPDWKVVALELGSDLFDRDVENVSESVEPIGSAVVEIN
jgi:hypothetical protein